MPYLNDVMNTCAPGSSLPQEPVVKPYDPMPPSDDIMNLRPYNSHLTGGIPQEPPPMFKPIQIHY